MGDTRVVGHSQLRLDGEEKVTGKTRYAGDLLGECLHASVLRSPAHHARIVQLDVSEARKMPGIIAVVTAEDVPGNPIYGRMIRDRPALAEDVVRHKGEPIAIVVGQNLGCTESALRKIKLELEPLPAVLDVREALAATAPAIHAEGNVVVETTIETGDVDLALEASEVVVEGELRTARTAPAYMEPESAVAEMNPNGTLTLWSSSQAPFAERDIVCGVLGIPREALRVVVPPMGGSFGGKSEADLSILAALAAWFARGKVKMVNRREESMLGHTKRHAAWMQYRIGARHDGTMIALKAEILLDSGAYGPMGPCIGAVVAEMASGPYRTANVRVHTRVVYTNGPPSGTIRSSGGVQGSFGIERMMDVLSEALRIDPIEVRRKNMWCQGDHTPYGVLIRESPSLGTCLDLAAKARDRLRAKPVSPGKACGVGVAASLLKMGLGYGVADDSTNRVEWRQDGGIKVHLGVPDLGNGVTTVVAQMVSEALGIDLDMVAIGDLDTATSPNGGGTITSRTTYLAGNSLLKACERATDILLGFASEALRVPGAQLSYRRGAVVHAGIGVRHEYPASHFARLAADDGVRLIGEATSSFPYPADTPSCYRPGMPHVMPLYGAQVARVEVDPEFGTVVVTDITSIHDVGRAINPRLVQVQIEGGALTGLGYALLEEMRVKGDGSWTDNFMEYTLPTILDAPDIVSVIVEQPEPTGPYGAKGLGESVVVATAPAILNAIRDATGMQVMSIPVDPELLVAEPPT